MRTLFSSIYGCHNQSDEKGVLLYTGVMVSRSYQIDGLLDALSDKGATIVRTRLLVTRLMNKGMISRVVGRELLESLETEAAVSSPQDS